MAAASLALLAFGMPADAHRLDEYLQATTFSLEKDRVQAQLRLTPGVAVFPFVMSLIDTDGDGVISRREQEAYADRVLGDLSLAVEGDRLKLHLISARFPETEAMKEGLGEIQIDFAAEVLRDSPERKLVFENHHQSRIASYLVNCLLPRDPDIRVIAQDRNYEQSFYRLAYVQGGIPSVRGFLAWSDGRAWFGSIVMFLIARLAVLWKWRSLAGRKVRLAGSNLNSSKVRA
jgi:hypothetical protein